RRPARDRVERLVAARRRLHGKALEAQRALEGLADRRLVVDDEDERLTGADGRPPRRLRAAEEGAARRAAARARAVRVGQRAQGLLDLGLVEVEPLGQGGDERVAAGLELGLQIAAELLE